MSRESRSIELEATQLLGHQLGQDGDQLVAEYESSLRSLREELTATHIRSR